MSKTVSARRNPYVSLAKFVGACFIVLGHSKFPGITGKLVECAGRLAVPFFFVISGYYSFEAPAKIIRKRIKKISVILLLSCLLYFLWNCFYQVTMLHQHPGSYISSIFNLKKIGLFLLADMNPFSDHLWYLSAVLKVYIALYLYQTFKENQFDYKPLYYLAVCAYFIYNALTLKLIAVDMFLDVYLTRNALFYGFPVFTLGIFLHNYRQEIMRKFSLDRKRLLLIFMTGMILCCIEYIGIYTTEMPVGLLPAVFSLVLLLLDISDSSPVFTKKINVNAGFLEKISMILYIIHPLIIYITTAFPVFENITRRYFVYPFFVLLISILASVVYLLCKRFFLSLFLHFTRYFSH